MDEINTPSTLASISFISVCTYLWIDVKVLWLYVILMAMDFATWFIKWIVAKDLQSVVAINWVFKKLILILLIFSIWITGRIMWFEDLSKLMSFAFSSLAIAEFYSILWNIYEIKSWKKTKEFDWVSFIISGALCFIEDKIRKYLDKPIEQNDAERNTKI